MAEWTGDDVFNDAEADEDRQRRKDIRRSLLGTVAGVAMLLGPIVLANAVVPDDDGDVRADDESAAPVITALQNRETTREADQARAGAALSMRTTTTAPPPPETTTTEATTTTTEAHEPIPVPPNSGGFGDPHSYETWDALAQCESGGNWEYSAGPYYGGLQFSLSTWRGMGLDGYPYEYSREEQIAAGIRLQESSGWNAWPACSRKLGLL
ncbi:MAG TPA: transglycosylase family protein [Acidimicrobiales bacterium]|jgi:hypothetical protein